MIGIQKKNNSNICNTCRVIQCFQISTIHCNINNLWIIKSIATPSKNKVPYTYLIFEYICWDCEERWSVNNHIKYNTFFLHFELCANIHILYIKIYTWSFVCVRFLWRSTPLDCWFGFLSKVYRVRLSLYYLETPGRRRKKYSPDVRSTSIIRFILLKKY